MPSDSALDRLSRVLDMVPLLAKHEMKSEELAATFGTDAESIRRDLEIAFLCGLPGYTPDLLIDIDFDGESISVLDPQVLNVPRQMDSEEVSILLFGLELIRNLLPISPTTFEAIDSLRSKISKAYEIRDVALKTEIDSQLATTQSVIEQAMQEGKALRFDYVDSIGVRSSRIVSPIAIIRRGSRLTLEAYDHSRKEPRYFFLAAVRNMTVVGENAIYQDDIIPDSEQSFEVSMVFTALPTWWIRRNSPFILDVRDEDSGVLVRMKYWKRKWLVRAVTPVVDRLIRFEDLDFDEREFRTAVFSHISGS